MPERSVFTVGLNLPGVAYSAPGFSRFLSLFVPLLELAPAARRRTCTGGTRYACSGLMIGRQRPERARPVNWKRLFFELLTKEAEHERGGLIECARLDIKKMGPAYGVTFIPLLL